MIFSGIGGTKTPASTEVELSEAQQKVSEAFAETLKAGGKTRVEKLRTLEKQLAGQRLKDPVSAETYAAVRTELKEPVTRAALKTMELSKNPLDQKAAKIFGAKTLSLAEARSLSSGFSAKGRLGELMIAQAYAKAGDDAPLNLFKQSANRRIGFLEGLLGLMLCGSVLAGMMALSYRARGGLVPLGLPYMPQTLRDADRLALKAAGLLAFFYLAAGLILGLALQKMKIDEAVAQILEAVFILGALPFLLNAPTMNRLVSLRDIGLTTERLGRNVLIGFGGFLIEFPVVLLLGRLGASVFKGYTPTHPAATEITNNHSFLTIIAIFLMGAVLAPIWEEIMFRGLLFPALGKVTKNLYWGGIISSLLFGMSHPQGPALWLALAAVGVMSCILVNLTKSLVPSMVLHFAHNAALLSLALLAS
jgi:membrane protease YdiL (CAAX protease family)